MFRQLRATDPRFKTVNFQPGLNIVVADKLDSSADTDSRNGAGKSAVVRLLHFLLGANFEKRSFLDRSTLRSTEFGLTIDWPDLKDGLQVRRTPESSKDVLLVPDITRTALLNDMAGSISVTEWNAVLEQVLFGLPYEHPGISGRALLSLYMRRVGSNAFNEPVRTFPRQSVAEATANIAYLLGLDWNLAARYRDLSAREATRRKLTAAVKDPVWGRIVGRASELRGQMTVVQQRVGEVERQIAAFQVVPEYENLQRRADELDSQIKQSRTDDFIDRQNLQDFERALEDAVDPEVDYLERVYSELNVALPAAVQRRYDEVESFHRRIVGNRRSYLMEEISQLRARLDEREKERQRLGDELAGVLQTLNEGGALATLTALQQAVAQERASLEALRHRYEAAVALEASRAEIKAERGQIETELRADLRDRESIIGDVNRRFLEYATRLYGVGREAYLDIEPTSTHLKIEPYIDSQDSRGIGNMVIFCFDLTVAVTAFRGGRGPDFLVHDSHLFDGVDERQVANALKLAKEVAESEGIQYIATLNSDDLAKAEGRGFDPTGSIIEPRLTDSFDDGGLFGFRFS